MIQNVILDWAGTLADDILITLEATNATLTRFGGPTIDLDTYRREFTIPVTGFYDRYIPGRSLREIDQVFFDHYATDPAAIPLFDGAEEMLRVAASRGQRIFLLSTVPSAILKAALAARGLDRLVAGFYGGAFDKREVLPRLVAAHDLVPDRTLFVGDSTHDVEAARAARVRAGAALYGYTLRDRLLASEPDYAFEDVAGIAAELDREHLLGTQPLVIATVGGVIEDGDGRFLLVRTRKWSDTFGIPGGKIQYGETMEEAYRREIREEVNLELTDTRFVMIQDCIESEEFVEPRHFLLINYVSTAVDADALRCNYEIEEARWVTWAEAMELPLNRPTRVVLEEASRAGLLPAPAGGERP